MSLSNALIKDFAKLTNDSSNDKTNLHIYGTVKIIGDRKYVQPDGFSTLTPISTVAKVKEGERVIVRIENHTAIVTGNLSSPSASDKEVLEINDKVIETGKLLAHRVVADELDVINGIIDNLQSKTANIENADIINADIEKLKAKYSELDYVSANEIKALTADIDNIKSKVGEFENISAEDLDAINAEIENLKGKNAEFTYVSAETLKAIKGTIDNLEVGDLDATYARIDLSNVTTGHVSNLFVKTGLLENATITDGHITGTLTGVKISGDLIEANTLAVKDLLLEGEDGLIYQINALASGLTQTELSKEIYQQKLNGTDIVANSITATQIAGNTITADKINVGDLFAQDITATGTITGLTLKGANGEFTGTINATSGKMSNILIGNENSKFSIDENGINGTYDVLFDIFSRNEDINDMSIGYLKKDSYDETSNMYIYSLYEDKATYEHGLRGFRAESDKYQKGSKEYDYINNDTFGITDLDMVDFYVDTKLGSTYKQYSLMLNGENWKDLSFSVNLFFDRKVVNINHAYLLFYITINVYSKKDLGEEIVREAFQRLLEEANLIEVGEQVWTCTYKFSVNAHATDPDKNLHLGTDYISLGKGFYMTGTGKNSHIGSWYFDEDGWFTSFLDTGSEAPEQYAMLSNQLLEFKSTNKLTQIGADEITLIDTSTGGYTTISNARINASDSFTIGNDTKYISVSSTNSNTLTINGGGLQVNNGSVYSSTDVYTGHKTTSGDGKSGVVLGSSGNIYSTSASNPYLYFYRNGSKTITDSIVVGDYFGFSKGISVNGIVSASTFLFGNATNKISYNTADGGIEIHNGYIDFHKNSSNDFDMRVAVFDANNMTIYGGNLVMNNGAIYLPNDVGLWSKNSSGTNKIVTGVSSGGNVYLGGSAAANATGNTNIYAGNTISFYANRLSGSYKAGVINLFREQSGSYRTVLRPASNGGAYLGTTSYRWNTAFFTNAITNSDLKNKDVIENFDFKVKHFIMGLEPIAYRRNGQEDTGKRIHIGLGAQSVASHIKDLDLGDLSMVQASIIEDGNERPYHGENIDDSQLSWGINYIELIPYTILMEQDHEYRIQQLEKENMYLRQVLRDNNLGGTI